MLGRATRVVLAGSLLSILALGSLVGTAGYPACPGFHDPDVLVITPIGTSRTFYLGDDGTLWEEDNTWDGLQRTGAYCTVTVSGQSSTVWFDPDPRIL